MAAQNFVHDLNLLSPEKLEIVVAQSKKALQQQQKRNKKAQDEVEKRAAAEDEARYRAEEAAERDDDPQANEEGDADETPSEAQPQSKAQKRPGKRGYWEQSDEDIGVASDEETVVVQPRAKKVRGPQVIIGPPQTVVNKLLQRRGGGHSRSTSVASTARTIASSSPPRPPPTSSDPPSTPPAPSGHDIARSFTPYKSEHAQHSAQGKQSPKSKTLLDTAYRHFRIKLAIEDAFPDNTIKLAMAKASFIEACHELNIQSRFARFNSEQVYAKRMTDSVGERTSQLRGEVKTKAQGLVTAQYRLVSLSEDEIKVEVAHLLNRGNFHFADTKNRKGMFENTIIPMILADQWFKRKSAEGTGQYSSHFNPCPLALIALIVTAVECALADWKTGLCIQTSNHFTRQEYNHVYRKHISSLEKYQKKFLTQFAQLQQNMWRDAWRMAGRNPSASGGYESDLDDEDFDDIKQRVSAPHAV